MFGLRASPELAGPLARAVALTLTALPVTAAPTHAVPADLVLSGGKIYTVDSAHSVAAALAIKDGKIVFVGSVADAQKWVGPSTKTEQLGGRLVLPGLIDSHLHPLDIVDLDVCNLDSKPLTLKEPLGIRRPMPGPLQNPSRTTAHGAPVELHRWQSA